MDAPPLTKPFTLVDVLREVLASVRATWWRHAVFGLAFVVVLFLACCGVLCAFVPVAMIWGAATPAADARPEPPLAMIVAIYGVIGLLDLALFAVHEGVTLELTHARARGGVVSLGAAVRTTLMHLPGLFGTVLFRGMLDLAPPALVVAVGAGVIASAFGDARSDAAATVTAVAMTLAYFGTLAWWVALRSRYGLALSCAVRDGLGPREAFARSAVLLRGRAVQYLALRVAFFVLYVALSCSAFTPLVVLAALDPTALERAGDDLAALLGLAIVVVSYAMALVLYTFDSILVGSYHACLARPVDVATIAKVFE